MHLNDSEVSIGINVDTGDLDEAIEKTGELSEIINDTPPMVTIKNCRSCTFNIYPSNTVIHENESQR